MRDIAEGLGSAPAQDPRNPGPCPAAGVRRLPWALVLAAAGWRRAGVRFGNRPRREQRLVNTPDGKIGDVDAGTGQDHRSTINDKLGPHFRQDLIKDRPDFIQKRLLRLILAHLQIAHLCVARLADIPDPGIKGRCQCLKLCSGQA